MEAGRRLEAVLLLQRELTPRVASEGEAGISRVHALAQLVMCGAADKGAELRRQAEWAGSGHEGRLQLLEGLQQMMPASEMLRPRRLERIVGQAIGF